MKKGKFCRIFPLLRVFLLLPGLISLFAGCPFDRDAENSSGRQAGNASHLIINQYYGANYSYNPSTDGEGSVSDTPVSHSFVELYNPSSQSVDLKGYSLQYADIRSNWIKLNLVGVIPAYSSFLVRANPTRTISSGNVLQLQECDQEWDARFNSKGSKIVLLQGTRLLNKEIKNPFNTDGMGTKVYGYVDMIGIGGNDPGLNDIIDGYENVYMSEQSKQKALRRIYFQDKDNNVDDFEIIDYRLSYISEWAKPRTVSSGPWNIYSAGTVPKQPNEVPMVLTRPYTLHSMFGKDPKTTWNFTWQTLPVVQFGHVQILENNFGTDFSSPAVITVAAERTNITDNDDPEYVNVARFIARVTGLKPGTAYNFRAGYAETGYVSGSFKTDTAVPSDFTFIHLSDSQSTTASGYRHFGRVVTAAANENPNLAFFLETGDLIDTVDREDEWRGFFESVPPFANYALVPVVGNHDQARGNEAASFRKHFTLPDNGAGGRTTPGTTYSFDYGNAHFVVLNTESNLVDQKAWLEEDLKNNKQKWIIVSLHKGIYQQGGKGSFFDAWASTLDSYEVDLVLNGHDHVYVRTYPMKNDQRTTVGGTVYLQTGGSGIKQGSKGAMLPYQEVQDAPGMSVYSAITVTNDRIIVETKKANAGDSSVPASVSPFYRFEIIKASAHSGLYPLFRRDMPPYRKYRLAG